MDKQRTRREFLQMSAAAGMTAVVGTLTGCNQMKPTGIKRAGSMIEYAAAPIEKVRVGYVGVGSQGSAHVRNLLRIEGCELRSVCDIVAKKVARVQKMAVDAGKPKPTGYSHGEYDFKRMCQEEDLDLVYTATPWNWHVPVCVAAMKNGKHAATEVPAAVTLDECWQLVETSEKYRKHCVMMENCCYDRQEMMCLNMVKKGLLGEILHGECGYLHDLRGLKVGNAYEKNWRMYHSFERDGNLYPTHGLGPVAQCMDINRGDRFDYLVSMSTMEKGLTEFAQKRLKPDHPWLKKKFKLGDVNISLIRSVNGKVICIYHDCSLPRPYSRIHIVQGTKGIFEKYPNRVHIEGRSQGHSWEELSAYKEYEHPLWTSLGEKARGAGHGGMDFIEDYRLIQALRAGRPMDMDVYDGAAWSAISHCSEQSVANRGRSIDIPDFTRGGWKRNRELHVMDTSTIG